MLVRTDSLSESEFTEGYERAASFWNGNDELTKPRLFERFAEPPTDTAYHWIPTSFKLGNDISFLPAHWETRWYALEETLRTLAPRAVLSLLPATLGMGPLVLNSFRRTHTRGMTVGSGNVPLASEIMRQLSVGGLIATRGQALSFFSEMPSSALVAVRVIHLVVETHDATETAPFRATVVRDLHLMPGVSVAYQCEHLSTLDARNFHPNGSFAWHLDGGIVRVTSIDERPAPLFRFRVGEGSIGTSRCACGASHVLTLYE